VPILTRHFCPCASCDCRGHIWPSFSANFDESLTKANFLVKSVFRNGLFLVNFYNFFLFLMALQTMEIDARDKIRDFGEKRNVSVH